MGDVVNFPIPLNEERRREFVSDMAQFADGTLEEKFLRRKYRLDDATWEHLGSDDSLVEEIENEKLRRIRTGESARQKAQKHFVDAPDVYFGILKDERANPKHRLEAGKELRVTAANGPEAVPDSDRFQITIVLSADGTDHVEHYDKAITIDTDPTKTTKTIAHDNPMTDEAAAKFIAAFEQD
jgi:hypothetical protein